MPALIFASGPGTRLGLLAKYYPKALIPIVNEPIILRVIKGLERAGIKDFFIVVGHRKEEITGVLHDVEIIENPDFKKGSLYSLYSARDAIDEDFLAIPCDTLIEWKAIKRIIKSKKGIMTLGVTKNKGSTGLSIERGSLKGLVKNAEYYSTGVAFMKQEIFDIIATIIPRRTSLKDILEHCLKRDIEISTVDCSGLYWKDVDTLEDFLKANMDFLVGRKVGMGTIIENSDLENCYSIGRQCLIENSMIDNACIGDRAKIINSQIINSVIIEGSIIKNGQIKNSVVIKRG
jgi:choline kinase